MVLEIPARIPEIEAPVFKLLPILFPLDRLSK